MADEQAETTTQREEDYVGEHLFIVGRDFLTDAWEASCSCGWESLIEHEDASDAQDAWDNHCGVVFMEATGGR